MQIHIGKDGTPRLKLTATELGKLKQAKTILEALARCTPRDSMFAEQADSARIELGRVLLYLDNDDPIAFAEACAEQEAHVADGARQQHGDKSKGDEVAA